MLQEISSHFQRYTPRTLTHWSQYLSTLKLQKNDLRTRFINSYGVESRGFRLLHQVLNTVEIEYLKNQTNDFHRYINWFFPMRNVSNRIFYPIETGRAYRKVFYKKTIFAPTEYICPTLNVDHLSTLPLGKSWTDWECIQPVHLWYNDSIEYTLNILQNQVSYKYNPPGHALIFVDVIALMFKYYKYMTSDIAEASKTPHEFLHKHVYSFFFQDIQNSWILNQLLLCVEFTNSDTNVQQLIEDKQYGYLGARYVEAMSSMVDILKDIKDGNLRVNSLLSSNLFPTGSLIDRIEFSFKYLDVEYLRQYTYILLLRDIPVVDLIIKLYQWRIDTPAYKTLAKDLLQLLKRYKNNKPWSRIYDSSIRLYISDWVDKTIDLLS